MPANAPAVGVAFLRQPLVTKGLSVHVIDLKARVVDKSWLSCRIRAQKEALYRSQQGILDQQREKTLT
jgi:hypothetical protein